MNNNKIYNGSKICFVTSQLFLIAGLYNIYHKNIFIGVLILMLYISSSIYHYNGDKNAQKMDIFLIYFTGSLCILISLYNKNIIPLLILIVTGLLYKHNNNSILQKIKKEYKYKTHDNEYHIFDNLYHTLVHLTAFIGTLTLIYNTKKI
jgi:hypothetical protein